jgi:hypothetical protein
MSTLSPRQRLRTVLSGGVPDRIPCIPLVYYFAASVAGVPFSEFTRSPAAYRSAMDCCFREVGPWDAMYPLPITLDAPDYHLVWGAGVGMRPTRPGDEDGGAQSFQFDERDGLLTEQDYERILAFPSFPRGAAGLAFLELLVSRVARRAPGRRFRLAHLLPRVTLLGARWLRERARWRIRGVPFFIGFSLEAPFDTISMARGITGFSVDLYRRGDVLERAVLALSRSIAVVALRICTITQVPNFLLLVHRSSNDFISPDHYCRFSHPGIRLVAEELSRHGIAMGLHCDGNWDLNFEHMRDLPDNVYLQLDGFSDVFHARRVLGPRRLLMGDVRPDLLAFGASEEVEAACERLLREVGVDGRFILSSGCEVPPNAKPENVRAMIASVEQWGRCR